MSQGTVAEGALPELIGQGSRVPRTGIGTRRLAFGLSLLLIFVIPLENSIVLPGFGTIARSIGLLATGAWVIELFRSGRLRRLNLFHVSVLLFVGWNLLSFFWSIDPERSYDRIVTYMQLFVMVLLIWDLYPNLSALRRGLQAFVFGCLGAVLSVFGALAAGNAEGINERYSASGFDQNFIGTILAIGISLAWFLTQDDGGPRGRYGPLVRIVNVLYIPAAVAAVLLTGSRTASLALIPGAIYIARTLLRNRSWRAVLAIAAVGAALLFLLPALPDAPLERVLGTGDAISQGDFGGRISRWRDGWALFKERPLLGVGSGAFGAASSQGDGVAHNVFLGILDEIGIVGFALFSAVLINVTRSAIRQPVSRSWLWLAILASWLIAAASLSIELKKLTWLLFTVVTVGAHIEDERPLIAPEIEVRAQHNR